MGPDVCYSFVWYSGFNSYELPIKGRVLFVLVLMKTSVLKKGLFFISVLQCLFLIHLILNMSSVNCVMGASFFFFFLVSVGFDLLCKAFSFLYCMICP